MQMNDVQTLATLEDILTSHRGFGDSAYLQEQMRSRHTGWLTEIAGRMPAAQRLMGALGNADPDTSFRTLGATVVRCAVQHAYANLTAERVGALSLAECEQILLTAADHLERGDIGALPLGRTATYAYRIGDQPHDGAIWKEPATPDALTSGLNTIIRSNYRDLPAQPEPADVHNLRAGVRLLRSLAPRLADSALSHAHLVAVVPDQGRWRGTGSSSNSDCPAWCFSTEPCSRTPGPWPSKSCTSRCTRSLYDFRFGHTCSGPPIHPAGPRGCALPWNPFDARNGNAWDTFRAFAALHVYVHLTFLCRVAQARSVESADIPGLPDPNALRQQVQAATVQSPLPGASS